MPVAMDSDNEGVGETVGLWGFQLSLMARQVGLLLGGVTTMGASRWSAGSRGLVGSRVFRWWKLKGGGLVAWTMVRSGCCHTRLWVWQ